MLTRKQHELLLFIDSYLGQTGFSPSFDEMKDALGLKSKSGIHRLISALEERGFIQRRHNRARALEVLRLPEPAQLSPAVSPNSLNVIKGDFSQRLAGVKTGEAAASMSLPLYGRIAAGLPIEALHDHSEQVEVPMALLGQGEHYALEVAGDSMIEAGILDGDTVIIRREDSAENGQIVVALIDDAEVTLKRLRKKGNTVALEAANSAYETRIVPAERLKIQGRLVGLLRTYH
ncbi:lexA repressor [Acetobacter aceti NRIC 0242]|uniref:LexA repressor n=1 Tax=Acetobacter aceti NBRC 14818 TaxID=887700 RepID=A0AB33IGV8_ACEAC|nr:transcriptional repressor LexA [Acetobacter aceti]TCS31941.1 SOS-response transcriptional repressor LexA [Acetobacter aceti NBRC 14818]BCK76295.1 LexA repressor [Acetobacter aceti NBRC 14818]GAN56575.1 transcriptional repressor LexA [Acetobacter aceti NBRC 14818]GBO82464.1 lexA repressor [Acetobacter aceti NRIC 0242]